MMKIIVQWYPFYWLEAIVNVWCAVVSIFTAYLLVRLLPIGVEVSNIIWIKRDVVRLKDLQDMVCKFEDEFLTRLVKGKKSNGR